MIEAFIALFVVANVAPILPVVLQFTAELDARARRRRLMQAIVLGNGIAIGTALIGGVLLDVTRITLDDLRIAGGIVLLVFAVFDLLFSREQRKLPLAELIEDPSSSSLVPLAVPVLVGPAVLTTVVLLAEDHGRPAAMVAVLGNAAINAAILFAAERVYARVGPGFGRALGKVMGLILAALAISMIRAGVAGSIATAGCTP